LTTSPGNTPSPSPALGAGFRAAWIEAGERQRSDECAIAEKQKIS
jgi:hypothetical protein